MVACDHGVVLTGVALTGDQLRLHTQANTARRKEVIVCMCAPRVHKHVKDDSVLCHSP